MGEGGEREEVREANGREGKGDVRRERREDRYGNDLKAND